MKKIVALFFTLSCIFTISAQEIYISSTDDKLYRLDINNCSYDFIVDVQSEVYDISFHPNGNLYGISGNGNFYEIDTLTGATSFIHDFNGQNFNSLTIAADGLVYTTGNRGELWSYNISSGIEIYLGDMGYEATGDLTFYDGQLYAAVTGDRIVLVDIDDPSNSSVIIEEDISGWLGWIFGGIYGIVSFAEDCDDPNAYALTNGDSEIYKIDFTTNSLQLICQLDIEAGGGASTFEFFASDPLVVDSVGVLDPNCNLDDGSITIIGTGGTAPLEYSIDGINFKSDGTFENLANGNYTVIVSDRNGCTISQEIDVLSAASPQIVNVLSDDASCGNSDGSITVVGTGGAGPLEYSIDGINFQSIGTFENLAGGNYTVIVRDGNGCVVSQGIDVLNADLPEIVTILSDDASCDESNGSITVVGAGGTGLLEYSIDGINFKPIGTFENLAGGSYTVMVKDGNGCVVSQGIDVLNTNLPEIVSVSSDDASCDETNGSITVVGAGGAGLLEYSIDGINFQSIGAFENLAGGSYTVMVKDGNGCVVSQGIDVLNTDLPEIVSVSSDDASCNETNGSITVVGAGGAGLLEYSIDGINFQSIGAFENLAGGSYTVRVKDGNGCVVSQEIDVLNTDLPEIVNVSSDDATCDETNGSITVVGAGGAGLLEYSIDGINFQSIGAFENLAGGSYTVMVKDGNGCVVSQGIDVLNTDLPEIVSVSSDDASCNESNGSITVVGTGGAGLLEYSIDGINFQSIGAFENLAGGSYTVMVKDGNGCTVSQPVSIASLVWPLAAQSIETISTSCGETNGAIIIETNIVGGVLAYSLNGNDYQGDNKFLDLQEGEYTVFIKDENGCVSIDETEVGGSSELVLLDVELVNEACGETNGGFLIEIEGGTGQIATSINGGFFQQKISYDNLPSGEYQVIIRDEVGCEVDTALTIEQNECPIYIPNAFSPNGDGYNDEFQIYPHPNFRGEIKALRIFDRWGALVFQGLNSDTEKNRWDGTYKGKVLGVGVYVYTVEVLFENGRTDILKGSITILK